MEIGPFKLPIQIEYGIAPPHFDNVEPESTVGQASVYSIAATSEVKEKAYDFIEWATTTPEGTSIYAKYGQVPSYSTDEALETYKEAAQIDGIEYRFSAIVKPEAGPEPYYDDINTAFVQEMELYLLDEQSLDDSIDNFYTLRDEVLENN